MVTVSSERVKHFVRIPVGLPNGQHGRFLLDSGVGLTVIAPSIAEHLGLVATVGSFTGRRMSGQAITLPLFDLPWLRVGEEELADLVVGVADLGPTSGEEGFDGILGLDVLGDLVVTVDPKAGLVHLERGIDLDPGEIEIPVRVERQGPSVCLFCDLRLPSGRVVQVEIDTGSGCLILDDRYMSDCGVRPDQDCLETLSDTDETGFQYVRRFATVAGPVRLVSLPGAGQVNTRTMFQDIIHEGLLGTDFLSRFIYSFDVRGQRLLLKPLPGES